MFAVDEFLFFSVFTSGSFLKNGGRLLKLALKFSMFDMIKNTISVFFRIFLTSNRFFDVFKKVL